MIIVRKHKRIINGKVVGVKKHDRKNNKYPLRSSSKKLFNSRYEAEQKIAKTLRLNDFVKFSNIRRLFDKGHNSLNYVTKNDKINPSRKKIHNSIIRNLFKDKSSIDKKDPDLYLLGGVASSGKTSAVGKEIPKNTINIDSDEFKLALSKYSKSPIKKYRLAHANYLHLESKILFERALAKAMKQKRNIILDGTLSDKEVAEKTIAKFRKKGYDIHLRGTQLAPHIAINRSTNRFLDPPEKGGGRFVSLKVISEVGNRINKNVMDLRKQVDTNKIVDTTNWKNLKLVSQSGNIKKDYRKPK